MQIYRKGGWGDESYINYNLFAFKLFYGGCKKMKLNGTFQFFYVMSMTAYEYIFFFLKGLIADKRWNLNHLNPRN